MEQSERIWVGTGGLEDAVLGSDDKFVSPLSRSSRWTEEDTTGFWSTRSFGAKKWPMQRVLPNRQGRRER